MSYLNSIYKLWLILISHDLVEGGLEELYTFKILVRYGTCGENFYVPLQVYITY